MPSCFFTFLQFPCSQLMSLPPSILIASQPLELSKLINAAERKDDGVDSDTKCSKPLSFSSSLSSRRAHYWIVSNCHRFYYFSASIARKHFITQHLFSLLTRRSSQLFSILNFSRLQSKRSTNHLNYSCHPLKTNIRRRELFNVCLPVDLVLQIQAFNAESFPV